MRCKRFIGLNALIDARKGGEKDPSSDILVKKPKPSSRANVDRQDLDLAHNGQRLDAHTAKAYI
jgi:hypothetical protein